MLIPALALTVGPQAVAPPSAPSAAASDDASGQGDVVVVARRIGRVTLLWDVNGRGQLTNCRVMRSSGNAEVDRDACLSPPPCPPDRPQGCLTIVPRPAPRAAARKLPPLDLSRLKPDAASAPAPAAAGPKQAR